MVNGASTVLHLKVLMCGINVSGAQWCIHILLIRYPSEVETTVLVMFLLASTVSVIYSYGKWMSYPYYETLYASALLIFTQPLYSSQMKHYKAAWHEALSRKNEYSRSVNSFVDWIAQSLFPFHILVRVSALDRSKALHEFKDSQACVWNSSRTLKEREE